MAVRSIYDKEKCPKLIIVIGVNFYRVPIEIILFSSLYHVPLSGFQRNEWGFAADAASRFSLDGSRVNVDNPQRLLFNTEAMEPSFPAVKQL